MRSSASNRRSRWCRTGRRYTSDLAYTLLKIGETTEARDQFAEAMRLDPGDDHVALEYAFLCYETKQQAIARRMFDRIRAQGTRRRRRRSRISIGRCAKGSRDGPGRWKCRPKISARTKSWRVWRSSATNWRWRPSIMKRRGICGRTGAVPAARSGPRLARWRNRVADAHGGVAGGVAWRRAAGGGGSSGVAAQALSLCIRVSRALDAGSVESGTAPRAGVSASRNGRSRGGRERVSNRRCPGRQAIWSRRRSSGSCA